MSEGPKDAPLTPAQRELVKRAVALVEKRARHFARRFRGMKAVDLFETDGKIAVVETVRRYDAREDGSFEAYAVKRIDGRMMDLVRAESEEKRMDAAVHGAFLSIAHGYPVDYDTRDPDDRLRECLKALASFVAELGFVAGTRYVAVERDEAARREYAHAMRALAEALEQLSESEQEVLVATAVDGLTIDEAFVELGIGRTTVVRKLDRARICLRKELKSRGVTRMPTPCNVEETAEVLKALLGGNEDPEERKRLRREKREERERARGKRR